jgi:hypothetical protein
MRSPPKKWRKTHTSSEAQEKREKGKIEKNQPLSERLMPFTKMQIKGKHE